MAMLSIVGQRHRHSPSIAILVGGIDIHKLLSRCKDVTDLGILGVTSALRYHVASCHGSSSATRCNCMGVQRYAEWWKLEGKCFYFTS